MEYEDVPAGRQTREEAARLRAREPELARVVDLQVAGLHARLYRPSLESTALLLYCHGGGWTNGSVETYDHTVRRLALRSGVSVLSLDYRLAPEHPWPAAIEDTVAALKWIAEGHEALGEVPTLAVGGDSAGGNIATLACHRLRDSGPAALPDLQVLIYPNTDLTGAHPSMHEYATGLGISSERIRFFARQWVPDRARWADPKVSPLLAPDLTGLPAALIVVAEYDPLRDEGRRYAERLESAGVKVTYRCEPGLVHSFFRLDQVSPACAAAADRVGDDLRRLLTRQ